MRALSVLAMLLVALAGSGLPVRASTNSLALSATYNTSAIVNFKKARLVVDSTATVRNPTGVAVSQLTFNLAPLAIGSAVVSAVSVDGQAAPSHVDDMSITVDLATPLELGQVRVRIAYRASLAPSPLDTMNGYFRKSGNVVSVARWIPWLSRPVAFSRPTMGNPFVTANASRVKVRLSSDRVLTFATSGQLVWRSANGLRHTYVAYNVRDFNFAAAPDYQQTSVQVGATTITLYYRQLRPAKMIKWAQSAFAYYRDRVGEYPWPTLTIAETESIRGLESPAHVWIPRTTASGNIPYLVSHEVAHQWFYGTVGSDQPAEPFADEAPTELLTRLVTQTLRASTCPPAPLDGSVYDYEQDCYFETIYIQGAGYLNDYRLAVGEEAFWRGIRDYYDAYWFGMGGTRQLLAALDAASGRDTTLHRERFPSLYGP